MASALRLWVRYRLRTTLGIGKDDMVGVSRWLTEASDGSDFEYLDAECQAGSHSLHVNL